MTDPDDRRSRSRGTTPPATPQAVPQPNFLADLAARIPQVQIPADFDAPRLHPMPRVNFQPPLQPTPGVSAAPAAMSLNDPEDPFGFGFGSGGGPTHDLALQRLAEVYGVNIPPEVQLPANWDALLQNPMPVVPPMPIPPRRGRGRRALGPLHDISGSQRDPALNGLHRGHIANREQAANHCAEVQNLLQQRQQQQERLQEQMRIEREQQANLQYHAEQQAQLQQNEEQQRQAAAEMARNLAWARERQQEAQQALEEEERQNMEAYQREVNHMHRQEELEAHTSRGSQHGNQADQQHSEAAAADYERNRHHENWLRREEETEQHRQQEANSRTHNSANNIPP